jgi:hypothetical protein
MLLRRLRLSAYSLPHCRLQSTVSPANRDALHRWIQSDKKLTLSDALHPDHVSDLFITLPTRDGTRKPFVAPTQGSPLDYGHHLAFFHPRNPESALRWDGTDADFCPPEPFTRRMWAGGRIEWKGADLRVGEGATARCEVLDVQEKGLNKAPPMVFVRQKIEYRRAADAELAIVEERSHVYLAGPASHRGTKQGACASACAGTEGALCLRWRRFGRQISERVIHRRCHSDRHAASRVLAEIRAESDDAVPFLGLDIQRTLYSP